MERVSQESYEELLGLIYEAALVPEVWEHVLRALASLTGCVAGGLTIENPETGSGVPLTFFGFDPDHVGKTFDYFLPQNPLHAIHERMQPGAVVTNGMAVSLDSFLCTEFYAGWARPQGLCCPVTVVLHRSGTAYVPLTLVRPDGTGDVEDGHRALLARLAPHLMRSFSMSNRLLNLDARSGSLAAALSYLSVAVLVLDEYGRVVFANAAAERLIHSRTVIDIDRNRKLSAIEGRSNADLQSALRGIVSGVLPGTEVRLASRTASPLAATVLSIPQGRVSSLITEGLPACLVVVRGPEGDNHLAAARQVGLLFGLTPSEERMLAVLLSGAGLKQSAARLGISYETARTHLKRIFGKTGTRKQGELIGLAAKVTPPLDDDGRAPPF